MEEKPTGKTINFVIGPGEGRASLERYLTRVRKLSAKAVKKLKRQGTVLVNGEQVLLKSEVKEGDQVCLIYPPEEMSTYLWPQEMEIRIIYEDEDVMVVDKEAGLCVHPTKSYPQGTLANGILHHWQVKGEKAQVHLVNRLDKDTSGLILVAKNTYSAQQLYCQQQEGRINRSYLALVRGYIPLELGTIDLPLAKSNERGTRRAVSPQGQQAVTHYRVVGRFNLGSREDQYSLLEVDLETGRTHQIRVHMSHVGYPLVGDRLYQGETTFHRQFLHACRLSFIHPVSGKDMEFNSPLPHDLREYLKKNKNGQLKRR